MLDLANHMVKGTKNYPKTMVETMCMLIDYLPQHVHDPDGKGLAFIQGEGGVLRGPKKDLKCWHCGGLHFKNECLELKLLDSGVQNLNINDWANEHNLFLANDGYRLVQKQAKGV